MMDGCWVEHQIERIRNSNGTFYLEAGAPLREVADRAIDGRPVIFEGDVSTLENTVTACFSAILDGRFHRCMLQSRDCAECPDDAAEKMSAMKSSQY